MGNPEHVFICSAICSWLWNNHVPILGHKRDCKNVELLSGDAAASLTSDTLRGKTLGHQLKLQVPRAEIDKFITQIKGFREASTQRGGGFRDALAHEAAQGAEYILRECRNHSCYGMPREGGLCLPAA